MPAPVWSRSFFTSAALIAMAVVSEWVNGWLGELANGVVGEL
jgi:hypothetical protein